ncbi:MAG TPA: hypothetical protein VKB80_31600 [Kofleriaceae bacterium]|nr:hypothetical protein [Kofleriaceae bacterium]
MRQSRHRVVEAEGAAGTIAAPPPPRPGPSDQPAAPQLYVIRADLLAGTVTVLWPAAARRSPRRARRSRRGGRGEPSS